MSLHTTTQAPPDQPPPALPAVLVALRTGCDDGSGNTLAADQNEQ